MKTIFTLNLLRCGPHVSVTRFFVQPHTRQYFDYVNLPIISYSQAGRLFARIAHQRDPAFAGFALFGYKNPIYRMKAGRSAYWNSRQQLDGDLAVYNEAAARRQQLLHQVVRVRQLLQHMPSSHLVLSSYPQIGDRFKWLHRYTTFTEKDEKLALKRNWITQFRLRTLGGQIGVLKYTRYMRYDFGYRHKVFFRLPNTVRTWRWMVSRRLCWASKNLVDARSLYVRVLTVRKTLLPYKIKGYQVPRLRRWIYANVLYRTGKRLPGRGGR